MDIFTTHEVSNLIKQSVTLAKQAMLSRQDARIQLVESTYVVMAQVSTAMLDVHSSDLPWNWPDWSGPSR